MYKDIVADTHILVDIIHQYYKNDIIKGGEFEDKGFLTKSVALKLNQINRNYIYEEDFRFGILVTSVFSFVEIIRQFALISANKFTVSQFRAFIDEKPVWMSIEPLSLDINQFLIEV